MALQDTEEASGNLSHKAPVLPTLATVTQQSRDSVRHRIVFKYFLSISEISGFILEKNRGFQDNIIYLHIQLTTI